MRALSAGILDRPERVCKTLPFALLTDFATLVRVCNMTTAPSSETVYIRIPARLKRALEAEAKREARTITSQLAEILRERYPASRR